MLVQVWRSPALEGCGWQGRTARPADARAWAVGGCRRRRLEEMGAARIFANWRRLRRSAGLSPEDDSILREKSFGTGYLGLAVIEPPGRQPYYRRQSQRGPRRLPAVCGGSRRDPASAGNRIRFATG